MFCLISLSLPFLFKLHWLVRVPLTGLPLEACECVSAALCKLSKRTISALMEGVVRFRRVSVVLHSGARMVGMNWFPNLFLLFNNGRW